MRQVLSIKVGGDWEENDRVRDGTVRFLADMGVDMDTATSVGMVACELTENAAKYGSGDPSAHIDVMVSVDGTTVTVEVKNRLGPAQVSELTHLDGMIQWIRGYQDPFEAYLERLKEVSMQTLDSNESGLGLVRIAYEGQSVLDFFVDGNGVVAVSAVHHIEGTS